MKIGKEFNRVTIIKINKINDDPCANFPFQKGNKWMTRILLTWKSISSVRSATNSKIF